ncbi:hypothetical protein GCM10027517_02560 [Phycicoccus ginsengisoli]
MRWSQGLGSETARVASAPAASTTAAARVQTKSGKLRIRGVRNMAPTLARARAAGQADSRSITRSSDLHGAKV